MATATYERSGQGQVERGRPDTSVRRPGYSARTLAVALVGLAALLVLATVLYTVRLSYRPRRGC